jgi:hypothetical protein
MAGNKEGNRILTDGVSDGPRGVSPTDMNRKIFVGNYRS